MCNWRTSGNPVGEVSGLLHEMGARQEKKLTAPEIKPLLTCYCLGCGQILECSCKDRMNETQPDKYKQMFTDKVHNKNCSTLFRQ
jgi:hypothetical protein